MNAPALEHLLGAKTSIAPRFVSLDVLPAYPAH